MRRQRPSTVRSSAFRRSVLSFAKACSIGSRSASTADLSPDFHPAIGRVRSAFEPLGLGGATGWGAEPRDCASAPARCLQGALSSA
jgi:hypothetical protein